MATPPLFLPMPNSSATPQQHSSTSLLLSIPSEVRLQIYSYLVPTQCLDDQCKTAYNLRLVCHQVKREFEHEAAKDMAEHFKRPTPLGPGKTFKFIGYEVTVQLAPNAYRVRALFDTSRPLGTLVKLSNSRFYSNRTWDRHLGDFVYRANSVSSWLAGINDVENVGDGDHTDPWPKESA